MVGYLADALLFLAALGAGIYCIVLSRRLNRFTDLERGVGGAIALLSVQVDDMTRTLKAAQSAASNSASSLNDLTVRAEGAARRLELLVAAMHDLPELPSDAPGPNGSDGEPESETSEELALFLSQRVRVEATG